MVRTATLALLLSACCPESEYCADESASPCVQAAFAAGETCGAAAGESAELGCSLEFDEYLACLDTASDCGTCESLRVGWTECSTDVCSYASRIDQGCFNDRPDCRPIFDEGNTPDRCLPFWRDYILCLGRSSPATATCFDQCNDIFVDFWSCD